MQTQRIGGVSGSLLDHDRALELLAARGLRPDPIDRERLAEDYVARTRVDLARIGVTSTRDATEHLVRVLARRHLGVPVLAEDHRAERRVARWKAEGWVRS